MPRNMRETDAPPAMQQERLQLLRQAPPFNSLPKNGCQSDTNLEIKHFFHEKIFKFSHILAHAMDARAAGDLVEVVAGGTGTKAPKGNLKRTTREDDRKTGLALGGRGGDGKGAPKKLHSGTLAGASRSPETFRIVHPAGVKPFLYPDFSLRQHPYLAQKLKPGRVVRGEEGPIGWVRLSGKSNDEFLPFCLDGVTVLELHTPTPEERRRRLQARTRAHIVVPPRTRPLRGAARRRSSAARASEVRKLFRFRQVSEDSAETHAATTHPTSGAVPALSLLPSPARAVSSSVESKFGPSEFERRADALARAHAFEAGITAAQRGVRNSLLGLHIALLIAASLIFVLIQTTDGWMHLAPREFARWLCGTTRWRTEDSQTWPGWGSGRGASVEAVSPISISYVTLSSVIAVATAAQTTFFAWSALAYPHSQEHAEPAPRCLRVSDDAILVSHPCSCTRAGLRMRRALGRVVISWDLWFGPFGVRWVEWAAVSAVASCFANLLLAWSRASDGLPRPMILLTVATAAAYLVAEGAWLTRNGDMVRTKGALAVAVLAESVMWLGSRLFVLGLIAVAWTGSSLRDWERNFAQGNHENQMNTFTLTQSLLAAHRVSDWSEFVASVVAVASLALKMKQLQTVILVDRTRDDTGILHSLASLELKVTPQERRGAVMSNGEGAESGASGWWLACALIALGACVLALGITGMTLADRACASSDDGIWRFCREKSYPLRLGTDRWCPCRTLSLDCRADGWEMRDHDWVQVEAANTLQTLHITGCTLLKTVSGRVLQLPRLAWAHVRGTNASFLTGFDDGGTHGGGGALAVLELPENNISTLPAALGERLDGLAFLGLDRNPLVGGPGARAGGSGEVHFLSRAMSTLAMPFCNSSGYPPFNFSHLHFVLAEHSNVTTLPSHGGLAAEGFRRAEVVGSPLCDNGGAASDARLSCEALSEYTRERSAL